MSLIGFKARNHPQQAVRDDVDDRRTPDEFFGALHDRHRFTIDAAASWQNNRVRRYFARPGTAHRCMWAVAGECGPDGCTGCNHGGSGPVAVDGLAQPWGGERVWCNPPYSRGLDAWCEKAWWEMAYAEHKAELVVMLLPANRCEQAWWQDHVEPFRDKPPFLGVSLACEFLRGRMRFGWPDGKVFDKRGDRPPFGCVLLTWSKSVSLAPTSLALEDHHA